MLFNSMDFLLFFPAVCLVYYVIPHKVRYLFLLGCSYYFYMCWNPVYALLMLTSTAITYLSGLLIDHADKIAEEKKRIRRKNLYVALSFLSNLSILFFFKYFNFAADTVVRAAAVAGITLRQPSFDVILPVGISFYTFQALSYTMDVYRKEIYAEKNFLKYALFVSFFPQLVAGPIERSKNLLVQISRKHPFDYDRMRSGLLQMLYGYFQKTVLSEYLAVVVDTVYDTYTERTGFQLAVATVLFAFQIYCDFGSYSNIAIGAARVMGFDLMEDFNTPYFAGSVAEFWRRWHISLSTWFRDYLYIPLGGNRKGRLRKQINLMIVFVVSGLWHGASWHFVFWGFLNGMYQVIGSWTQPVRRWIKDILKIDENSFSHKMLRAIATFSLIDFSWIFFRASFRQALGIIRTLFHMDGKPWFTWGSNMKDMGLGYGQLNILIVSFGILLLVDAVKYRGIDIKAWIMKQGVWFRFLIYYALLFFVLIFAVYGPGYDASEFIYFQF